MNTKLVFAVALLLGCMSPTPVDSRFPVRAADDYLPPATRALVVPGTVMVPGDTMEGVPSLLDLVHELADCTGQELLMDLDSLSMLAGTFLPLLAGTEVPADEVYTFVESILVHHYVFIAPVKGGEVPVLGVYPMTITGRGNARNRVAWTRVDEDDLPLMEDHPALLVETVLHLPSMEIRQLSTSMRSLLSDQNTQIMIPIGDHGILLRTTGREAARTAKSLFLLNEAATYKPKPEQEGPKLPGEGR